MQLQLTTVNIQSSLIKGIDYYKGILTLDFGRKLYAYKDVPAKVVIELIEAESVGKYFNDFIKDVYEYVELQ